MSIKRYNTFCRLYTNKRKNIGKAKKIEKKPFPFQKVLLGMIVVFLIFIGINFFSKPLLIPSNLEEETKQVQPSNTESIILSNSQSPGQLVGKYHEDSVHEEKDIQGIQEIRAELDRLASHEKLISETELSLKYQAVQQERIKKVSGQLNSGETLYQYLVNNQISPSEILRLEEKVQSVVDISRLNVGTKFTVHCNPDGEIVQFDYQPNQLDAYCIKIPESEMENIEIKKDDIFREIVCFEGEIETSLYQAMIDYCNSGQLAIQLAEIFAWDIDFLTECQPGDTFKILVEKLYRGDFYRWGDILAAVYEGEMLSTHTAVLFEDSAGNADYYDENGRCLRKAFLRAPLNYKYISSHYTESRYHPILRIWRPHLAIDYAAPTGTPVVSIGAGTVISRYYHQGGYGNYVEIKHPNGYVTGYGHLSKFAQGLHVGQRVEQGEVIGYVGATGLATGPHLDFSISKDGKRFNFLELELPPASSVSEDYREDFELVKKTYLSILKEDINI